MKYVTMCSIQVLVKNSEHNSHIMGWWQQERIKSDNALVIINNNDIYEFKKY